jgi:hypothetical protein
MNGNRARLSWLIVLVFGLVVLLAMPGVAAAATGDNDTAPMNGPVDAPPQPAFAIPGIVSVAFGPGLSPQIELPALNATASVNGLNVLNGWNYETINLTQNAPATLQNVVISEAQATVGAPSTGYSTQASAHVVVQPKGGPVLAQGQVGVNFNGLKGQAVLSVQDGSFAFMAGPALVSMTGLQGQGNARSFDNFSVSLPATGGKLSMAGYASSPGKASWENISFNQDQVKLGTSGSLSNVQVQVAGPSSNFNTQASFNYAFGNSPAFKADGQVTAARNSKTGQTTLALQNANVNMGGAGWTLGFNGINTAANAMKVNTIAFGAPTANLSGEISNLQVTPAGAVSFDKALLRYQPDPATMKGQPIAGWELSVTPTASGYMVSTNMLVAPASK